MASAESSDGNDSHDGSAERAVGRIVDVSEFLMETLELVTGVVLIVLFGIGLYDLVIQIWERRAELFADIDVVLGFIDTVLVLLVIVEVFRTVVAFSREETVVRIIIDASLVAVARKVIGFDSSGDPGVVLLNAVAISVLLLTVIAAFYVVRSSDDVETELPAAGDVELSRETDREEGSGDDGAPSADREQNRDDAG